MAKAATKTAKKPAAKTKAPKAAATFADGSLVEFVKYAVPLAKGEEPLFKKGETGRIVKLLEAGEDEQGPFEKYEVLNETANEIGELYYPGEIKATTKGAAKTVAAKGKSKASTPTAEVEGETEEAQLILTDAVSDLVEGKSAVEAARELVQGVQTSYFTLGGVLAYILDTGAYKDVQKADGKKGEKYDDFFEFCNAELGQERVKAYQLMQIYRSFSAAGVDEKKFRGIGWTYARSMAKAITADNADDLLEQAQEMSRDDFDEYVKETYVADGGTKGEKKDKIKKVRVSLVFHGDQADLVAKVFKQVGKQIGIDPDAGPGELGSIVHYLAAEFIQNAGNSTLAQDVAHIEQTHGVKLAVEGKVAKKAPAAKTAAKPVAKKTPAKAPTKVVKTKAKKSARAKA